MKPLSFKIFKPKLIKRSICSILFVIIFIFINIYPESGIIKNNEGSGDSLETYITTVKEAGDFIICEQGKSAPLYVSSQDYLGVIRALKDLQIDIDSVTDSKTELSVNEVPHSNEIVIAGTIGKSPLINKLIKEKKINADSISGKWETFLIQIIDNPFPNVEHALVIAGSDKRGTIYGIYDISEKIGVSPWHWWADVPVKKHSGLYVTPGIHSSGSPAVKYRGIFLNDESPSLTGWANEKFGGLNHKFYEHVFELILRLKGNYLWPAMWSNMFYVDDTLNPKLADEYGIVIGTSHHEPMMRAWKEWDKYGHGEWNYQTNDSVLREYWGQSIKRMDSYESIVTLGMRGNGDEAMSQTSNIGLLEKVISDQRDILANVTDKDLTTIPQVWALYKEVQEYYDKGMRVPDDVTLLLCDDNWGNLRKLPKLDTKPRKGGYGIYYHFDYVGGPRNYKWLNTVQIERVYEQMHLAIEYGANRIWIVNVGDLKPLEFPISFFMDYAWNPKEFNPKNLPDYYTNWAREQFGEKYAEEIGNIMALYTKYNARRKPELLSPGTYSLVNYDEAEKVVDEYNQLAQRAKHINNLLSPEYKASYYQLVLYPVTACANLNDLYVTAAFNHLYAEQGRAATDSLAEKVKELFKRDAELSNYYNKVMEDGKWDHMMDQTHIGYTYWQQPDSNNMPKVEEIELPSKAEMGVAIQGSSDWRPKDSSKAELPEFDRYNKQTYYIEIFNRGSIPFKYSVEAGEKWLKITPANGTVKKQERIWISVDWNKAPSGKNPISITINGSNEKNITVLAEVNNPSSPEPSKLNGFVESNGYISINADHFNKATTDSGITWEKIPNLGRTNSAMTAFPVTSESLTPGRSSPHLEYNVYLFSKGEIKVEAYFSPTLNSHNSSHGIRYGVSFDNEEPQIINMTPNPYFADLNHDRMWNQWVADNINIEISKHTIEKEGEHVLKFWMVDPGPVLQKLVIDTGGEKPSYLGPPESYYNNNRNEAGL